MPDGTSAAPEIKSTVTTAEALHSFGAKEAKEAGFDAAKNKKVADMQSRLNASTDPKDWLKAVKEGKGFGDFSSEKTEEMLGAFGMGKATKDTSEKINIAKDASAEAKALFAEANSTIVKLKSFQQYSELLKIQAVDGIDSARQAARDRDIDYDAVREIALDSLVNDLIYKTNPELVGKNIKLIKDYLDDHLVKDPTFRQAVSDELAKVNLPTKEVPADGESARLGEKVTQLTEQQKTARADIKRYLDGTDADLSKLGRGIDEAVTDYVQRGYTTEQVLNELKHDLTNPTIFPDNVKYLDFMQEEARVEELRQRYLKTDPVRSEKAYRAFKSEYNAANNKLVAEKGKLDADFDKFKAMYDALSSAKDGTVYKSRTAQRIAELVTVKPQLEEAQKAQTAAEAAGGSASATARAERIAQEKAALEELRGVIPKALATTLLDRMEELGKIDIKDQQEKMQAEELALLKTMQENRQKRGLGYEVGADNRAKRIKDRGRIVDDARMIAARKDEGIRTIALENTGWLGQTKIDDNGNEVRDTAGNLQTITSYDDLNTNQKRIFDKTYAVEAKNIKLKVMSDLINSRNILGKLKDAVPFTDKNGLNKAEWEEFAKYYSSSLREVIAQSTEGKRALQQLDGLNVKGESKFGLLAMLAMALITGGVGVAALGGIGAVGGAIGSAGVGAAKGIL